MVIKINYIENLDTKQLYGAEYINYLQFSLKIDKIVCYDLPEFPTPCIKLHILYKVKNV